MISRFPGGVPRAVPLPADQIFHAVTTQPLRCDGLHLILQLSSLRPKDRRAAMWRSALMALEDRNVVHVVYAAEIRWQLQSEAEGRHLRNNKKGTAPTWR